jgi:hypothetical protein
MLRQMTKETPGRRFRSRSHTLPRASTGEQVIRRTWRRSLCIADSFGPNVAKHHRKKAQKALSLFMKRGSPKRGQGTSFPPKKFLVKLRPTIAEHSISETKGGTMENPPAKLRLRRVRDSRNSVCISAALEDLDWKRWGEAENFGSFCLEVPDKVGGRVHHVYCRDAQRPGIAQKRGGICWVVS